MAVYLVYWKTIFSLFGWSLVCCRDCGAIYIKGTRYKKRIWGKSCSNHLKDTPELSSITHPQTFRRESC